MIQTTDIAASGYGLPWSHTRTYSNRISPPGFDRGNGWNWNPEDWPYLVNSPFPNATYALLGNLYDIDWFEYDSGTNSYTTLFGRLRILTHDATNEIFTLLDADGTVTTFNDMSHATRPGLFKSITTPGGNTLSVFDETGSDILEVQRSYTSGGDTYTESFLYDFIDTGDHIGHLERCTLRRKVNSGSWQPVLKAEYSYYGSSSDFGSLNDLQTVTRYEWDGSAWQQLDVNYYRYWKQGDTDGFEHGLKFVVGPNAYQNMLDASLDPLTASNSQLAVYADNYYEYDSNQRVTTEIADAGSQTYTFTYTDNPNTFPDTERRYNFWWRKTTETRPDGNTNIVFANRYGQTMLDIVTSGTDEWISFAKYDDDGRTILEAAPSAVTGYDQSYNDLLNEDVNGDYEYLRDSAGLIHVWEFYTTTGSGAATGYLKNRKVKEGQNGTEIKLVEYEYTSHSANGDTIYPVSKETIYPDASNQATTIETSYAYTFYTGTTQVEQKTTTLPVISTSQNGTGTANSFFDVFDKYGNLIWHKDERGFITRYKYDIETGAMTQRIDDVDTAQVSDEPSGWTTPTGGGLHLVSDYEHDDQGRITQSLGPVHTIDLNGTATSVRTAQWMVYKDYENTTLTAKGFYQTIATTYTLVNPVRITITDKNGNLTDSIQAVRASTGGKLQPTDSFSQSTYVRWTTHQYTECCKLISSRVYHTIPTSGTGSSGANYDQTDFGYDVMDRQNRTTTPGGTITYTVFDARNLPISIYVGTDDKRFHNATGTGELGTPISTEPKARVSYSAAWQDGIGRAIASAEYGTNGGSTFSRQSTIPARSDTILVSNTEYDDTGEVEITIDPAGTENRSEYDDAGRMTKAIENYRESGSSSSSSSSSLASESSSDPCPPSEDQNRTTVTTYNADGNVATLVAWNAITGDQATTYVYGTTLTDSEIATSTLLRRVKYPDSTGDSDSVEYKYNRQSQTIETKDQNGTIHSYDYDALGRPTQDRVTTLGTNVDGAVRRIASSYDVRGLQQNITSYDNATVGSGSVVNDVQFAYNDFGQRTTSYQAHGGAVNTSTTPKVQYAYTDGSANTVRPTSLTYPDGRVITYSYGTSSGKDDNASRISALVDDDGGSTHLADYEYLGLTTIVEVDYTQADVRYTLFDTGVSGDIYTGLDRFSRIVDSRWYDYGASQDAARIKYGYNRDSSRLWRQDSVAAGQSKHFDELYDYDGLQRLKIMQRGSLNTQKDAVTNKQFAQCWSLDETGNWDGFRSDDNGDGTWNLVQDRIANTVNEITNINETTGPSWVTPAYDAAGNMTTVPRPADPTASYAATYDAWNRVVKLVDGANTVQESQYDGRRYRIVVKNYVSGSLDDTRHVYFTGGWQAIEERPNASTDPDRQYIRGIRYIDDLVLRDRDTNGTGTLDERLYVFQDGTWNVVAIADTTGDVQERFSYTAYGNTSFLSPTYVARSSSNYYWTSLFASYTFDHSTHLCFVRCRTLHNVIGVWLTRDPVEYVDGPNSYSYARSMPTAFVDPYGLACDTAKPKYNHWSATIDKRNNDREGQDYIEWWMARAKRDKWWVEDIEGAEETANRGCVGIACLDTGYLKGNMSFSHCYDTLDEAEAVQKEWNKRMACCDKSKAQTHVSGKRKVEARIYMMQFNNWFQGRQYEIKPNPGTKPKRYDLTKRFSAPGSSRLANIINLLTGKSPKRESVPFDVLLQFKAPFPGARDLLWILPRP